jgi:antitoxin CptB
MPGGQERLRKLRWQSRRGMKELDVLLESFIASQGARLLAGDWPELELLLGQEDDVLFDWISGRNLPRNPAMLTLIERLVNAR